jgi:hypothetical protein
MTDRATAVDIIYAWDDDDNGTYDDLADRIAKAIAAEGERVLAPIRALVEELDADSERAYQRTASHPHNDYDAGMQTAYDSAADRIRAVLPPETAGDDNY